MSWGPLASSSILSSRARIRSPGRSPFPGNHAALRQQGFGVAEIDYRVTPLHTLHRTGYQCADALIVAFGDLLPFRLADLLHDHLLRSLGGDPTEFHFIHGFLDQVTHLDLVATVPGLGQRDLGARKGDLLLVGNHFPNAEGVVVAGIAMNADTGIDFPEYHLRVAVASAASMALNMISLSRSFSRETTSAISRISLLVIAMEFRLSCGKKLPGPENRPASMIGTFRRKEHFSPGQRTFFPRRGRLSKTGSTRADSIPS